MSRSVPPDLRKSKQGLPARRFAEVCAPHPRQGQTVAIMPGALGALKWPKVLRDAGITGVALGIEGMDIKKLKNFLETGTP